MKKFKVTPNRVKKMVGQLFYGQKMPNIRKKNKDVYKDFKLDKEGIKKAILEMYPEAETTYEELIARCLSGYYYQIEREEGTFDKNQRTIKLNTNKAGAIMYLESCQKIGVPPWSAGKCVIVYADEGPISLSDVKVKKINKSTDL